MVKLFFSWFFFFFLADAGFNLFLVLQFFWREGEDRGLYHGKAVSFVIRCVQRKNRVP